MDIVDKMTTVTLLVNGLDDDITAYETIKSQRGYPPVVGVDVSQSGGKASIQRRILTIRELLMEVSNQL